MWQNEQCVSFDLDWVLLFAITVTYVGPGLAPASSLSGRSTVAKRPGQAPGPTYVTLITNGSTKGQGGLDCMHVTKLNVAAGSRVVCLLLASGMLACTTVLGAASSQSTAGTRVPEPYDLEKLYQQTKQACPDGRLSCLEPQLHSITAKHGPRAAVELFTLLRDRGVVPAHVDGHHVVHHIGHETAMVFGTTADALALCPDSYNYGCMHGFFQHALGMGGLSDQAAAAICDDLQKPSLSWKTVHSCFHGFGHGVMVNSDYDLNQALGRCDKLESPAFQRDCWQGVFMENVDSALEGNWQKGGFSQQDPLAPCDTAEEKYRFQCFVNQSAWIMKIAHNDIASGAQACLKAPGFSVAPCLEGLGLLTTNRSWQASLLPGGTPTEYLEAAWSLCKRFPEGKVSDCVVAGLDNLLNSGLADEKQGQAFCETVDETYRQRCTQRIHEDLRYLTPQIKKPDAGSTGSVSE